MTTETKEGLLEFLEAMTQAFHLLDAGEKSFIVNRGKIVVRYNLNPDDDAADIALRKINDIIVRYSSSLHLIGNDYLYEIANVVGKYLAEKDKIYRCDCQGKQGGKDV